MAKTKALISFAVTAKLICVFVFAYAKSRFSHDAAQIVRGLGSRGIAKTKMLIMVTAQLICAFVFAYSTISPTIDIDNLQHSQYYQYGIINSRFTDVTNSNFNKQTRELRKKYCGSKFDQHF